MNLYPIQQQHLALISIVEDNDGEVADDVYNALQLTEAEFKEQALSVGYCVKHLEDRADTIKKEIDRLKGLLSRTTSAGAAIELKLKNAMQQFGMPEIKGETLKLSFRKSESVLVDEDVIGRDWCITKTTHQPDKAAIKKALKEGQAIPGARLVENQNLQIR